LFYENEENVVNLAFFSENGSEKQAKPPRRRYPKRSVGHKDYTEGRVPDDDDYICKYLLLLLLLLLGPLPPPPLSAFLDMFIIL
jgi:hypothetical protein